MSTRWISECWSWSSSVVLSHTVNNNQSSFSSAGFCLSAAASERTELFMALCISQVVRWMVRNAPPAAHSQFLLIQLWGFILTRLRGDNKQELYSHTRRETTEVKLQGTFNWTLMSFREKRVMKTSKTILYVVVLRMKRGNKLLCGPVIRHQNKVYHRHITVINLTSLPRHCAACKKLCIQNNVFSFLSYNNPTASP